MLTREIYSMLVNVARSQGAKAHCAQIYFRDYRINQNLRLLVPSHLGFALPAVCGSFDPDAWFARIAEQNLYSRM